MGIDATMLVRTKCEVTPEQVRRLGWELGGAFSRECFFYGGTASGTASGTGALEIVKEWTQDGPTLKPEPGETFIRVNLSGRYYGIGYERGDLPTFIAVAVYLQNKIPGATIWYGGDSSGAPFDRPAMSKLWEHFVTFGHLPYHSYFDCEKDGPLCPVCDQRMIYQGGGGGDTFYFCYGCDKGAISGGRGTAFYTGMSPIQAHQEYVKGVLGKQA